MNGLQQLFASDLPIPLWQIVLYVGLVSYFMFQRWFKLAFLTSFLLALYWLHYAFRPDLLVLLSEARLARAIYYLLGFALILLSIFALTFLEVDTDSLLEKREKEITRLKAQAKNAEKTAAALQAQLANSEAPGSSGTTKRAKKLNAKIDKLEGQLRQTEQLLEARDGEITALQAEIAEAKKNVSALEALLEMCKAQEAGTQPSLEGELRSQIAKMEAQVCDYERLLQQREAEISALHAKVAASDRPASVDHVESQLRSEIEQLKDELQLSKSLLEQRSAEIAELQARASDLNSVGTTEDTSKLARLTAEAQEREQRLRAEIARLSEELEQASNRLQGQVGEAADWKAKASDAEKAAAALKAQLEKEQAQYSASRKKLEESFTTKIAALEKQLKQTESGAHERNTEISELRARADNAERQAKAFKARLEKEQAEQSASSQKKQEQLDAHLQALGKQLQDAQALAQMRDDELTAVRAKLAESEQSAAALRRELDSRSSELSSGSEHQAQLRARIESLEQEVKQEKKLVKERAAEVNALQRKAAEAEKHAAALTARLEREQRDQSSATKALQADLKKKIAGLEEKLQQYDVLLENRNTEIAALQAKIGEGQRHSAALEAEIEKQKNQASEARADVAEEFRAKISDLEAKLDRSERLLKDREADLAESRAKTKEAEESASNLKTQLQQEASQSSSVKKVTDDLHAKIVKLDAQLSEGETLLKARNSEIAALRAQVSEAEKNIVSLKAQLEKAGERPSGSANNRETELHTKITTLERQLKETADLLHKRNAELEEVKAKTPAAGKRSPDSAKAASQNKQAPYAPESGEKEEDVRRRLQQFQYAVKYLEDEIKEKDRLISLMTKKQAQATAPAAKNVADEDLKKKVHQLEQSIKYLESQNKEKDGLLSLMAKRNRELADLKSKAEEKLEALEASLEGSQTAKADQTDARAER